MREVDIATDLHPRHHGVMRALGLLSNSIPIEGWCLVGGMMVLVAARAAGHTLPRPEQTKDGDIVVDVCANHEAVSRVAYSLRSFGYDIPKEAWDREGIARCTFVSGTTQIDVLCPDDAADVDLGTSDGIRSLAIPGGRRALELSEPIRIHYAEEARDVELRVPLLPGAIIVKASAALDQRTAPQHRHAQDLGALLAIIDDLRAARNGLSSQDISVLISLRDRLLDDRDPAWEGLSTEHRQRAQAALRFLTST